ncbi:hypothetical protein [Aquimarina brevivitae]|nr:hypothetical protein [Aquimarina brevivitae]
MKYLPVENITYHTDLNSNEVLHRLEGIIESFNRNTKTEFYSHSNPKYYIGTIDDTSFSINRIVKFKNPFLPRIIGTIQPSLNKTQVTIKMKLHGGILLYVIFHCGAFGLVFLAVFAASILNGKYNPNMIHPLSFFLIGYGLTMAGFKYESIKSKKYFAKLLEAEYTNSIDS